MCQQSLDFAAFVYSDGNSYLRYMKILAYAFLAFLAIGCKKKNSTPDEVVSPEPIIIKSYRINVNNGGMIPPFTIKPGTTNTYTCSFSITLLINDTVAIKYLPVPTSTTGIYKDALTNTILSQTLTPVPYFKTGDNMTWRYTVNTNSPNTHAEYYVSNLYLTEKGSKIQIPLLKMTKRDSIPIINGIASRDYSFKLP